MGAYQCIFDIMMPVNDFRPAEEKWLAYQKIGSVMLVPCFLAFFFSVRLYLDNI
jgi:hypothetical protein